MKPTCLRQNSFSSFPFALWMHSEHMRMGSIQIWLFSFSIILPRVPPSIKNLTFFMPLNVFTTTNLKWKWETCLFWKLLKGMRVKDLPSQKIILFTKLRIGPFKALKNGVAVDSIGNGSRSKKKGKLHKCWPQEKEYAELSSHFAAAC